MSHGANRHPSPCLGTSAKGLDFRDRLSVRVSVELLNPFVRSMPNSAKHKMMRANRPKARAAAIASGNTGQVSWIIELAVILLIILNPSAVCLTVTGK